MTESHYLPIKESLGYKNVKKALTNIFPINLDYIEIRTGEFENFGFTFLYGGSDINMGISSTGKKQQFEFGEGGVFDSSLPNPRYPQDSFLSRRFLSYFIVDPSVKKKLENIFGKNEKDVEYAMQVLKDYLDKRYEEEHK